jgi:hypothetical protein
LSNSSSSSGVIGIIGFPFKTEWLIIATYTESKKPSTGESFVLHIQSLP